MANTKSTTSETPRETSFAPVLVALAKLVLLLVVASTTAYGYFRDELYYLACSEHLGWGYPDHPPLSVALLALNRWAFGDSLVALRWLPALAGSGTVLATGVLARELGGGRRAQLWAALASCCSLISMGSASIYSMNVFDALAWSLAALVLVRLVKGGDARGWIVLGVLVGLGAENKISMLWLGAAVAVGLVATQERRWLKTPWPWICGAVATLLFVPYLLWNWQHDWAHLTFMRNAASIKYASQTPYTMLADQLLIHNPATVPMGLAGLFFFFRSDDGRPFRMLGYIFVVPLVLLVLNWHSKAEYLAPAFVVLFAGGAVLMEPWSRRAGWTWLRWAYPSVIIGLFAIALPMVLPLMSAEDVSAYAEKLGVESSSTEGKDVADLPQFYADMHGWEAMAQAVAEVVHGLPAAEREDARIYADNYGRCGAIDFFGKSRGLPPCLSGHNAYWLWGADETSREPLIVVGGDRAELEQLFESVELAGTHTAAHVMPYENHLDIYVCRRPRVTLETLWPTLKNYI